MQNISNVLVQLVRDVIQIDVDVPLSKPPDSAMGDYAIPCFQIAQKLGVSAAELALKLSEELLKMDLIKLGINKVEPRGPYLNVYLSNSDMAERVICNVFSQGEQYGTNASGIGKRALVEHTSINPNASPHLGRARNAWIGDTLVKLLRFEGYDTETHFFVNDVGRQIAILVLAVADRRPDFGELLKIYIAANKRLEKEPSLENDVNQILERQENGDSVTKKAFRRVVDISVKGMRDLFSDAGIYFDHFDYESLYLTSERYEEILEKFRNSGTLFEDEHGRLVLNLEGFNLPSRNPVLVVTRSNKTSLYPLRDIAYTLEKVSAATDINLVVLGEDQKLYHRQIQAALKIIGCDAPVAVHYSFVVLGSGSMSTRQGNLVLMADFVKEAKRKATTELRTRSHEINPQIAKAVAYSALKYSFLRVANDKQIVFDWDKAMSFEGESGPYLLYSHARICSILRRYNHRLPTTADYSVLKAKEELELIKLIADLPDYIARTLRVRSPHVLAGYTFSLARHFSIFYHACPILKSASPLREARLLLVIATRQVLSNCLRLLGMEPVDRM